MTELGVAYISIRASTGGLKTDARKALQGIEADATKTGQNMGSKLSAGIGSALKKTAVGVGVTAGAAIAAGLTKGVGRLTAIEGAEAKLRGLGNSASTVQGVMTNALAAVKGTAFGLEEAGTVAAGMVAAGIKPGRELEGVLKTVGDTAAIAGVSMKDMGSIFGKVAATGKLQGDELMQLSDAGIPALSLLSKHLGKTTEEVRAMVSAGKISFADFEAAMRGGVQGAALEMGNTTAGAFKNMGAAAGRLGATLAGPFYEQAGGAFRGITSLLDDLNAAAGPAMQKVSVWLGRTAESAKRAFTEFRQSEFARSAMADLRGIMSSLASTATQVWPALKQIAGALGEASAALGVSAWDAFVAALNVASGVLQALVGPLNVVAGVMEAQPGLVTAAVASWMAFKTVPTMVGHVGTAVSAVQGKVKSATGVFTGFGQQMQVQAQLAAMSGQSIGKMGAAVAVAQTRISGAMGAIKKSATGVVSAFGGPWGVALAAAGTALALNASSAQSARAANDALANAVAKGAEAQRGMFAALAETNNELSGQALAAATQMVNATLAETIELGSRGHTTMENLGHGIDNLTGNVFGLNSAWEADYDRVTANVENYEALKAAASAVGVSMDNIGAVVAEGGPAYDQLISHLRGSGEAGQRLAADLEASRANIQNLQQAAGSLTPGAAELGSAIGVLADKASTADEKLGAMKTALQALGLIQTSAEQQAFQYAESIDKIVESAQQAATGQDALGQAMIGTNGKLLASNDNARALNSELSSLGDEFLQAALKSGDAAGEYAKAGPALDALAGKYGLTSQQVRDLAAQYGLIPEQVQTLINVAGYEGASQQVATVMGLLNTVPPGKTVTVQVEDQQARDAITAMGLQIVSFDDTTGTAEIRANNGDALSKANQAWGAVTGVNGAVGTGTLDANGQPASAAVANATGQIQGVDGARGTGKLDADNSSVWPKVNEAQQWIFNLKGKTVSVVFRAVYEGFRNMIGGGSDNNAGGAWTGVHALPRFAKGHNGYRLPTTGPGTEVTDGFLAFNSDGIPAAHLDAGEWIINKRSSRKHNRLLAAINRDDPRLEKLPRFAGGLSAPELDREARRIEGVGYVFGGWGNGWSTDCTGAAAILANLAITGTMHQLGRFYTGDAQQFLEKNGFKRGRWAEGMLGVGYTHNPGGPGGGHAAATLPGGTNVEMGGGRGNGQYGGGAAGANDSQFANQYVMPLFSWAVSGVHGWDQFMPPTGGDGATVEEWLTPGGGSGGSTRASKERPTTWSGIAGQFAKEFTEGQVSDALGVFGIPDQLPPILQAWNALNEAPEYGGPSDWDLSVAAANFKKFDAQFRVQSAVVEEAANALESVNRSPAGNALPAAVLAAQARLDGFRTDLAGTRASRDAAQAHLEDLVGTRSAALAASKMSKSNASASPSELAATARGDGPPDIGLPDSITKELKIAYDPAGGAEQWRPMVIAALKRNGFAATQREQDLMIAQIKSESGGNPGIAQQIVDVNGTGDAAGVGLLQIIPGTFAANRDPELPNDRRDPWANMNAALRYYKSRYGMDLGAMWGKGHGYNLGGWISGQGTKDSVPLVGAPGEFIVNRKAAAENRAELEAMNSGRSVSSRGGSVTYNIHTFDLDEAMRELSRREAQHAQTFVGAR